VGGWVGDRKPAMVQVSRKNLQGTQPGAGQGGGGISSPLARRGYRRKSTAIGAMMACAGVNALIASAGQWVWTEVAITPLSCSGSNGIQQQQLYCKGQLQMMP